MSKSDTPWERKSTRSHPIKSTRALFSATITYPYIFLLPQANVARMIGLLTDVVGIYFCLSRCLIQTFTSTLPSNRWDLLLFPWNIKNLYYNSNKLAKKVKQLKSGHNVHYITFISHKTCSTDIIEILLRNYFYVHVCTVYRLLES